MNGLDGSSFEGISQVGLVHICADPGRSSVRVQFGHSLMTCRSASMTASPRAALQQAVRAAITSGVTFDGLTGITRVVSEIAANTPLSHTCRFRLALPAPTGPAELLDHLRNISSDYWMEIPIDRAAPPVAALVPTEIPEFVARGGACALLASASWRAAHLGTTESLEGADLRFLKRTVQTDGKNLYDSSTQCPDDIRRVLGVHGFLGMVSRSLVQDARAIQNGQPLAPDLTASSEVSRLRSARAALVQSSPSLQVIAQNESVLESDELGEEIVTGVRCSLCWMACGSDAPQICAHPACKAPICEVYDGTNPTQIRKACGVLITGKGGGPSLPLCRRCSSVGLVGLDASYCEDCGRDCEDGDPLVQCGGCDAFKHLGCDTPAADNAETQAFAQAIAHDQADWLCRRCASHRQELSEKFPTTVHPPPAGSTGICRSVLPSASPSRGGSRPVTASSSSAPSKGSIAASHRKKPPDRFPALMHPPPAAASSSSGGRGGRRNNNKPVSARPREEGKRPVKRPQADE